jgi:CRP/FNR family cyclic AMP-dependent transcriptional regulator
VNVQTQITDPFSQVETLRRDDLPLSRRVSLLENTRWVHGFDYHMVKTLARYMEVVHADAQSIIFEEGEVQPYMGLIIHGVIEVLKEDSDGEVKIIATLRKGNTIGEMALIDGEPRSAAAMALEDVTMLVLSTEGMNKLIADFPRTAVQLLIKISTMLSRRLRRTSGALVEHLERPTGLTLPPPALGARSSCSPGRRRSSRPPEN